MLTDSIGIQTEFQKKKNWAVRGASSTYSRQNVFEIWELCTTVFSLKVTIKLKSYNLIPGWKNWGHGCTAPRNTAKNHGVRSRSVSFSSGKGVGSYENLVGKNYFHFFSNFSLILHKVTLTRHQKLYAIIRPKLNFGCYLTFEFTFLLDANCKFCNWNRC